MGTPEKGYRRGQAGKSSNYLHSHATGGKGPPEDQRATRPVQSSRSKGQILRQLQRGGLVAGFAAFRSGFLALYVALRLRSTSRFPTADRSVLASAEARLG